MASGFPAHGAPSGHRLLRVVLAGESVLAAVALAWMRWRELPLELGPLGPGLVLGLVVAAGFAASNLVLVRYAPAVAGVRSIRRVYRDLLRPLFATVTPVEIGLISLAAGVGEELLFRGAIQPEIGLPLASLLFGALHVSSSGTLVFGAWVALLGAVLGGLAVVSQGLLAPIVAHAVYDAAAITYIRFARWPDDAVDR